MRLVNEFSGKRAGLIFLLWICLLALLAAQLLRPFLHSVSDRFTIRGDQFLVDQEYGQAAQEYQQALYYDLNNSTAVDHLQLAEQAPTNIKVAEDFFKEHNVTAVTEKLDQADGPFPTAKDALTEGVALYTHGDFVYAQYPLEQAVRMDPNYPEAWNYLGLTYQELGKVDSSFLDKAKSAFQKRDSLTPKYIKQPVS